MKIPPAPKSIVAPKFAFGCVSDSDEEQQDTPEVQNQQKVIKIADESAKTFEFGPGQSQEPFVSHQEQAP